MFKAKLMFGIVACVLFLGSQADAQCFLRKSCAQRRSTCVTPRTQCPLVRQCVPVRQCPPVAGPVFYQAPMPQIVCGAASCGCGAEVVSAAAPEFQNFSIDADVSELRGRLTEVEKRLGITYGQPLPSTPVTSP